MSRAISRDDQLIAAEETLIADVQFAIHNLLEAKGMSRTTLARALGVTDARVSQIFQDNPRNLTLRTIARIFRVVGEEPRITSRTLDRLLPAEGDHDPSLAPKAGAPNEYATLVERMREVARMRDRFEVKANDNLSEYDLVAA